MKKLAVILSTVLAMPAVAEAGDFRCKPGRNGTYDCSSTSLFPDYDPYTGTAALHQQMEAGQARAREAARQAHEMNMMILEYKLKALMDKRR